MRLKLIGIMLVVFGLIICAPAYSKSSVAGINLGSFSLVFGAILYIIGHIKTQSQSKKFPREENYSISMDIIDISKHSNKPFLPKTHTDSPFLEKLREANKGKPLGKLVHTYFSFLDKIREHKKDKDYKEMLMHCQLSLSLIEPFIEYEKKEHGSFDISSIPAIEEASVFYGVYGSVGQLKNLKELVENIPELKPWEATVERGFLIAEITSKLYKYVKDNPGRLQREMKNYLGYDDGKLISIVAYYLERIGKIKREKAGNTYKLYIA